MSGRKVRRNLYFDQDSYEAMVAWAESLGISHSELVRDLVNMNEPGKGDVPNTDPDVLTANKWWTSRRATRKVNVAKFHDPDAEWVDPPAPAQRPNPALLNIMGVGSDDDERESP